MKPYLEWLKTDKFHIRDDQTGKEYLELVKHQEEILGHIFHMDDDGLFTYDIAVYACPKKSGKPLSLDTIIPTPDGYTTMGEIDIGDIIFDQDGESVEVTYVTDVMYNHSCYELIFANGEKIVASGNHEWPVIYWDGTEEVRTTLEIHNTPMFGYSFPYRVSVPNGLFLNRKKLPIHPYVFGLWLGDGHSKGSRITVGYEDLDELVKYISMLWPWVSIQYSEDRAPNISLGKRGKGTESFGHKIKLLNVYDNKHIPIEYLRSSYSDRLDLICGLMDSDGYIDKNGRCEFTSTNCRLAYDVQELLASLGYKSNITIGDAKLHGRIISKKYRLHFMAYKSQSVFMLKRKQDRLVDEPKCSPRSKTNTIKEVNKVDSVPVKCIEVDSNSHCFLIGRTLIPTHNTTVEASVGAWLWENGQEWAEIYCIANSKEHSQSRAYTDIRYHLAKRGYITHKYRADNPDTNTFIEAIAREYKSAAGARPLMSLWDELWAYEDERGRLLWSEMTTPTIKNAMRFIVTYAGVYGKAELLWELYENNYLNGEIIPELAHIVDSRGEPVCRKKGGVFVYWDTEPRMPWQTIEYYESEAATQRPMDFLRLHRNEWVTGEEEFLPIRYWEDASKKLPMPLIYDQNSKYRRFPISIGVDASWKHDETVVVGCFFDPVEGKVGQAFHKIWVPGESGIDLEETVEAYILAMSVPFNINCVVYDPRQLHRSMTTIEKKGIPVFELPQTQKNLQTITMNLHDIIKDGRFMMYQNDECTERIKFAKAENKGGMLQFVKNDRDKVANDYCLALAMAAYDAINRGGVDTTIPLTLESPYGDQTDFDYDLKEAELQRNLPPELRTVGNRKIGPEGWNPGMNLVNYRGRK